MLSFSLNAALHVVKFVFQLLEDYLSTNISNTLTKCFDSVTCASKNGVFEVWINKVLRYCKIWKPCRKFHHSDVKQFFQISNRASSALSCWKYPSVSSSPCNSFRKGSDKSLRYLAEVMVWLKKIGSMIRLLETASQTPIFCDWWNHASSEKSLEKHIVRFLTHHLENNFQEETFCLVIPSHYKYVMKIVNECFTTFVIWINLTTVSAQKCTNR
jgi:hypothetical protein